MMRASTFGGSCEVPIELRVVTGMLCTREIDSDTAEFMVLGLEVADIQDQECDLGVTFDFQVRDLLFLTSVPEFSVTIPAQGGAISGEQGMDATVDIFANEKSSLVAFQGALPAGTVTLTPSMIGATWSDPEYLMFEKDVGGSFWGIGVVVNFQITGLEGTLRYGLYPEELTDVEDPP